MENKNKQKMFGKKFQNKKLNDAALPKQANLPGYYTTGKDSTRTGEAKEKSKAKRNYERSPYNKAIDELDGRYLRME